MENLSNAPPSLDNGQFAKFSRDCLVDKTITSIDIDITFNKCKEKTARRIEFNQFKRALEILAEKKYGILEGKEPYVVLVDNALKRYRGPSVNATVCVDLTRPGDLND